MADGYISQIKTPDNKVYLLKDSAKTDEKVKQTSNTENKEFPIILKNTNNTTNETNGVKYVGGVTVNPSNETVTATEFIGNIKANRVKPTIVKEWNSTSFYGANISGQDVHDLSTFWMLSVKPDSWYEPWVVRFKITTTCPAAANYYSVTYCMYSGRADGIVVFNWNERYDHAHYYTNIRTLKKAGFDAGLGHAIGINLYASNNYTNANYYRSFKLEYYDCDNCTVTILDTPVKWANWSNGTTTNYNGNNNANAVDRGLQESGDANSYDLLQMSNNYIKNGAFRFPGISMFGYDREGHAQAFSLYQTGYTSYTASASNKETRIYNTNGIDWTRGIHYNASGGSWAENADMNITVRLAQSAVDLRYTDNCVSTANTTLSLVSRKAVYIRGTLDDNGLFHVAPLDVTYSGATYCRVWTQDIPTQVDNYVYWFIGYPYYTSAYQVNLYVENPLYWFHNERFEEYRPASTINLADVTNADDLKAIEAISGTSGLLKKTAANTWTLDTNTYLTAHRTYTTFTGKPTGNQTPGFGDTFTIQQISQNTVGQVSGADRTVKIPSITSNDIPVTLTRAQLINTEQMSFSSWLPKYNSGTAIPAKTMALFADGLVITSPATGADAGWIRVTGTDETNTVLEIATSDDANKANSEKIVVRQYNSSSAQHEAILLGKIGDVYGATSFPVQVSAPKFIGALQGTATSAEKWTTARTLTIGNTGKSVDGSGNVSWSLAEIGAASSDHEHNYIGKDGFIAYPSDGRFSTRNSHTGYIKIKIPYTKSATMFTFDVDIYNYLVDTSVRYHIGGYNYDNASWVHTTAYCIAPLSNAKGNLTVRFWSNGNDEMYVSIGEPDTAWAIPSIIIHNITLNFNNDTLAKWKSGWTITIENTAFDANLIKATKTNTNIAYKANAANFTSTKWGIAYYSDTAGTFAGTGAGTSGQYLKSNGSSAPTWATFSASTVGLGNVENTKLSTWTGSANITTVGTISTGTWHGTKIANDYIANPKVIIAGNDVILGGSLTAATLTSSLGLSNALHFIGITSTTLTDGSTTATLTAKSTNSLSKTTGFIDGDVVMDGDQLREYVWSGSAWRLLGITTSTVYTQPASTATNTWISQISQGTDGKITATTGSLNTSGTWSGTATKATTTANTTDTLYLVGIKSGATSTLLHDTSITVKGNTLDAGIIKLHQGAGADPSLTGNARIEFDYSNGQPVIISYTPNDSYRAPAGLKVMGGTSATPAWFEVEGNIYAAAFKGNADTASALKDAGNNTSITAQYSGAGASATDWFTEWSGYKLVAVSSTDVANKIRDKASGNWSINISGTAATSTYLKCSDTRNAALNPTDLDAATGVRFDFKAKATISLTATDPYAGVMSFRPYAKNTDWSGGPAHQIAFNSEGLHWRSGGASWDTWSQILDSSNTAAGANATATLSWGSTYTLAKINGTDIKITMPGNPNTDHYAWSDITSKPETATRWPTWNEVTSKPSTFAPSAHEHKRLQIIGRLNTTANMPYNPLATQGAGQLSWGIYDGTSRSTDANGAPSFDAGVINLPWDWGGYNGQIAISNTVKDNTRMQIRSAGHIDNGEGANPRYTPNYGAWREVVTATKATKVGDTNKPVYINATGQATAISYTIEKSVPSNAVFTDHYAWGDITSKPDTATRWPKWNEIAAGADALSEGTSNWTDNTEILTSYASNNGFADSAAKGVVYRRDALCAYNYIKGKLDSVYIAKSGGTMTGRLNAQKGFSNLLTGTGTAGVNNSGTYTPVKWTFNAGVTVADGDRFTVKIPNITNADWGVFMSVNNGTNYYPVGLNGTGRLTTHYPVNTYIDLVFEASGQVNSVFPLAGGTARVNVTGGCWRVLNYYVDGNPGDWNLRQYNIIAAVAITGGNIIAATDSGYRHLKDNVAFDIRYPILYAGSNIGAGAAGSNNYLHHYAIGIRTTQPNATFTAYKPLFIEGTLSGNTFTPISATPLTQTIPTSDNGHVYYYIGRMYNSTDLTFDTTARAIFWYKNGVFQPYGGAASYAVTAATASSVAWTNVSSRPTKITLTGAVTGSVSLGAGDLSLATTVNHTHNYAGSSTAGGAATNAVTTANTADSIYPVGVKSGATTTLLHDTSITMKGGAINATTYTVNSHVTLQYNTTDSSLDFIFT